MKRVGRLWEVLGIAILLPIALQSACRKPSPSSKAVAPAEQHYQDGLRLAQSGDTAAATYQWKTAIGLDPTFAPAYFALAQLDEQSGNVIASADRLEHLRAANPHAPQIESRLASLYFRAGRYEKGMALAQAAVQHEPNEALAHAALAEGLAQADEIAAGVQELRAAHRLAPGDETILLALAQGLGRAGNSAEGLALMQPLLIQSRDPALVNFVMGELLLRQNSPQAGDYLKKSLNLAPNQTQAQSALGSLLLHEGRLTEAQPLLESAYRQNPTDLRAIQDLATVYARLKRPAVSKAQQSAAALKTYQTALFRARQQYLNKPDDKSNSLTLAQLEAQRGNGQDALDLTMQILHSDPDNAAALKLLHHLTGR